MSRLKPPLAFPLSRLIQAGVLALLLAGTFIPTRTAHADDPPPILPGGWRTFTTANAPIALGAVEKIFEDSQGRVWIGTDGGVIVYRNGVWQTFTEKDGLAAGWVDQIIEDRAGRVWVGTWDGVSVCVGGVWQTFTEKDGLVAGYVTTILEDRAGRVWVGTDGGVSVYADGAWQTLTAEKDGMVAGGVNAIFEDRTGRVWVGTDGGVSVYAGGAWQTFTEKDGLATGTVTTIIEDHAGRVWVGTRDGVSVYAGGAWQTFAEKDGLVAGGVNAIFEDRTGRVWVGTSGGVSVWSRRDEYPWVLILQVLYAPSHILTGYVSKAAPGNRLALPPGDYRLRVDFSGSDMDSREGNVFFRYRLQGHEEWQTTKTREVPYTNLGPGDYTFVVKSVDEDALESPPATLQIHIERFWWQSPIAWAGGIASLGLLTFGAVLGTQRWRRKRQLEKWRKGHDPYIVGAVIEEPDKFYGREEMLTKLTHALEAGNHIVLYGERRIGKTSLLHQLAHQLNQTGACISVFFEMQGVPEDRFFLALMNEVAKTVRERAEIGALLADNRPERYDSLDMRHDLDNVFDVLKASGDLARIVLLLDEADTMNSYDPHVQAALRGLLMRASKRINLVWSGQHLDRQWRLDTSPWYNLFSDEIRLGGIEQAAAVRLIRQPVKGVFEYDDAAVERILKYSDSKPYQIQRLCSACVRRLLEIRRDRVTVDDVDAAYQALTVEDKRLSSESSAPISYQISSPAHQVAEKKADYKKDDAQ